MKLQELKLFEEPIQTRPAEEVWGENESSAQTYITTTVYYVRPVKGSSSKYEVLFDQNGTRKTFATMDEDDLNAAFVPIRPNQKADAEGFIQYRSADVYDAFKYTGDPIKLQLGGSEKAQQTAKLNKGDYVLRQDNDKDFVYTVERANYFDNNYMKKS